MNRYIARFFVCFVFVLPSWLAGAVQNMANGSDLVVTAGVAASLAWVLGLARSPWAAAATEGTGSAQGAHPKLRARAVATLIDRSLDY